MIKKPQKIGPWPLGIDNLSDPTDLKADDRGRIIAVRDAVNVDIDRAGSVSRRRGGDLVMAMPGLHSLWAGPHGAFAVAAGMLYAVAGGRLTPIGELASDAPCSFDALGGATVVSSRSTLALVRAGQLLPLGAPDAPAPQVAAAAAGGLAAGRYSVAISFARGGQEGALSRIVTLVLGEGQGLQLSGLPSSPEADVVRIYRTSVGGTELYHCADVPVGLPSYLVGGDVLGRAASTRLLTRMPPGDYVTVWRGRLLLARGRTLVVSRPMAYGLTSPRFGFVQFADPITLVAGVEGGVYVGTRRGVVFLRGSKPSEWAHEAKTTSPPVPGCRTMIDGDLLAPSFQQAGHRLAAWLAAEGIVLGADDGTLIEPQADRLRVPLTNSGTLCVHGRRLTATLH